MPLARVVSFDGVSSDRMAEMQREMEGSDQPENVPAQANDNGAQNPVQGYAGHYCNVPTRVDPEI